MSKYKFKIWQEVGWAFLIGCVLAVFQMLATWKPEDITDWRLWATAFVGSITRSAAAAAGNKLIELLRADE